MRHQDTISPILRVNTNGDLKMWARKKKNTFNNHFFCTMAPTGSFPLPQLPMAYKDKVHNCTY